MKPRSFPGRGSTLSAETKRISIAYDDETFEQIRTLAVKAGVSFAEQNRQLVEIGLEEIRIAAKSEGR